MGKNTRICMTFCLLLILLIGLSGPLEAQANYRLNGLVTVRSAKAKLTTVDGRVFLLDKLPFVEAAKFDGKNVEIHGSVKQSDDLGVLTVKAIKVIDIDQKKVVLPPYKGHQRPPRLVSNRNGVMTFGNLRWRMKPGNHPRGLEEHEYRNAMLRPDMVENVYFTLKPFAPEWIAAHSLFIFTLRDGALKTTKDETSNGIILSIEAWQRKDQSYSLKEGLKDTFGVSWILTSFEDYMDEIAYRNDRLVLYPVNLSHQQKAKLLEETIRLSCVDRRGEFYHTVTNNCTNNLIVLLNRVLEPQKKVDMWWLPSMAYNLRATVPVAVPKYLVKKKILIDNMREIKGPTASKSIKEMGL
ncbi:MAG: DUF4105 domain-containing protein [Candidatus Riflebacteria bacterium]